MKKLVFLFMLFSFNANAANFTDTLGAQCAEILLILDINDYPINYDTMKKRNSQFWALQRCLNVYKENGGDLKNLEERFLKAKHLYDKDFSECLKNKKDCNLLVTQFKKNIQDNTLDTVYYHFTVN